MEYLDRTFPTVRENLVHEERLLAACERGGCEYLCFWEPREYTVVAGYSNREFREIHLDACEREGVPVVSRHSGGGTVVLGPGCLNFALILRLGDRAELASISKTNLCLMARLRRAVAGVYGAAVSVRGHTDLALGDRKFSGNAQHRRRSAVLFHGTLMRDMDIGVIERILVLPSRAPAYRQGRSHQSFLTNLPVAAQELKDALRREFTSRVGSSGAVDPCQPGHSMHPRDRST
jgi:lipoate---protein ligase